MLTWLIFYKNVRRDSTCIAKEDPVFLWLQCSKIAAVPGAFMRKKWTKRMKYYYVLISLEENPEIRNIRESCLRQDQVGCALVFLFSECRHWCPNENVHFRCLFSGCLVIRDIRCICVGNTTNDDECNHASLATFTTGISWHWLTLILNISEKVNENSKVAAWEN